MDSSAVFIENTPIEPVEPVEENKLPSLVDAEITDENTALNIMVSFIYLAQKRGAFNLQESSKIWECVQLFTKKQ